MIERGTINTGGTSVVSVLGDVTVRGEINHQGTLVLHNDLFDLDGFVSSTGSLHLVGSNQDIQLGDVSLSSLSVRGGGTKLLSGKIAVLQQLSLVDGILETNDSSRLMLLPSTRVNGGSSRSYVDGFLYHSSTGKKFCPVGKDGVYAPATLHNVTGNNPTVGIAYFPSSKLDGTEFHWQQTVVGGTYDGSTVELTFTSENSDYQEYGDELAVLATETGSPNYSWLGQSSLSVQGNRFSITSGQPTALPILTVGFDNTEVTQRLYLPNAFSPTAPNPEDRCIKVYGQHLSSRNFYFAIQDVWGATVYETTSKVEASTQGWRGTTRTASETMTYRYRLEGEFIGGEPFRQTGTIVQY